MFKLKIWPVCMAFVICFPAHAGITWGEADSELGALTLSGALRAKFQNKDFSAPADDNKIQFDMAVLKFDYDAKKWFGKFEYRCYQYAELCDFSPLVTAHIGYKITDNDRLTMGIQPIPFGPAQYWDSSYFAGLNNTLGLNDVHYLGVNYQTHFNTGTQVDLAYFPRDAGNYIGSSRNASRYSAAMIKAQDSDQGPVHTHLKEKQMWVGRVMHDFDLPDHNLNYRIGASYWYSDIENRKNNRDGSRHTWAVFNRLSMQDAAFTLTAGKIDLDNKDRDQSLSSSFGSFDTEYELANQGYFYTLDSRYTFNDVREGLNISPYLVLSAFDKSEKGFETSQRHIAGLLFSYKNMSLYTEYLMSKNDAFVGGTRQAFAQGDGDGWNKMMNMEFSYNF